MDFVTSALIVSWVAIGLLAFVVARLVQQVHELQRGTARQPRRIGLTPGEPAPGVEALDPRPGAPMLLLFLSTGCRTCREVLDEAVSWRARETQAELEIRVLYAGEAPAGSIEVGGATITAYGEQAPLFERYDALATPFAVLVNDTGQVARSEPLGSREAAGQLLASVATHERSVR